MDEYLLAGLQVSIYDLLSRNLDSQQTSIWLCFASLILVPKRLGLLATKPQDDRRPTVRRLDLDTHVEHASM